MGIPLPISDLLICPGNCSGNGDCLGGTCLCQVYYSGSSCSDRNLGYYLSFGVIFYIVCFMAIVQLVLCIRSDFLKLKKPNLLRACKLNVQKLVYVSIICATGSRSVYFILGLQDMIPKSWQEDLYPLFYTFVLSGFSLIICFWAESFHLSGLQLDRPRFLTKSYYGFIAFNLLMYLLIIAQVISNHVLIAPMSTKVTEVIHCCLAFLMFFTLVFFLIYGVEIFCKIEGAFKPNAASNEKHLNFHQLFQSRLGLLAQAAFQLAVTMFFTSEVLGEMWKRNIAIGDRNIIDITFHVAEVACALWFPCCLWNVSRPGDLWILNPKNLLTIGRSSEREQASLVRTTPPPSNYLTFSKSDFSSAQQQSSDEDEISDADTEVSGECWICYDDDEALGNMIRPCECKGDTAVVHHECLKRWLLERLSNGNNDAISCSVCKAKYQVSHDSNAIWLPNGIQIRAWSHTFFVVVTMIALPISIIFVWGKIPQTYVRIVVVAFSLMGEYLLVRVLGFNFLKAYKITKTRAMKILGRHQEKHRTTSDATSHLSVSVSTGSEVESHLSIAVNP